MDWQNNEYMDWHPSRQIWLKLEWTVHRIYETCFTSINFTRLNSFDRFINRIVGMKSVQFVNKQIE